MKKIAIALVAMSAVPGIAEAQAFTNGSFEDGAAPGAFVRLDSGSTAITGWTVGSGSVDYVGSYWNASDGARSVDLSGLTAGSLSQTFDTVLGRLYNVTFDLGGNGDGPRTLKTLDVFATGGETGSYSAVPGTRGNIIYSPYAYSFTATGASTTLTFASTSGANPFGPVLDNVSLTAVPEPAAWALLIAGVGAVGGTLRRRRGPFRAPA